MDEADPLAKFGNIKKILLAVGLWPIKNASLRYRIRGVIFTWIPILIFAINFGIRNVQDFGDVLAFADSFTNFASFSQCVNKFRILMLNDQKVLEILSALTHPNMLLFRQHLRPRMIYALKVYKLSITILMCIMVLFVTSVSVYPLIDKNEDQPLPFPFPYNLRSRPIFKNFLYIVQVYSIIPVTICYVYSDILLYGLIIFGAVHFQTLGDAIKNIVDVNGRNKLYDEKEDALKVYGRYDKIVNKELANCVKYHLAIFRYIDKIQEIYAICFLFQIFYSALVICTIFFNVVMVSPKSVHFAFLMSFFFTATSQLTLYTATANEMTVQSLLVGDSCYIANWTDFGPQVRKTLFIIMERAKRPSMLTAKYFIPLSLATLTSVLGKSMSYFMVLRTLYAKDNVETT